MGGVPLPCSTFIAAQPTEPRDTERSTCGKLKLRNLVYAARSLAGSASNRGDPEACRCDALCAIQIYCPYVPAHATGRTTHQQQARSYPQEHIQRATRAFGKVYAVKRFVQINFTH